MELVPGEPTTESPRREWVNSDRYGTHRHGAAEKTRHVPYRCPQCRKVRAVQALEG